MITCLSIIQPIFRVLYRQTRCDESCRILEGVKNPGAKIEAFAGDLVRLVEISRLHIRLELQASVSQRP